jgi:hypothetical protein
MQDISRFKAIFSGLDIAYGTYQVQKEREDGKQNGKACVIRKPPTDDLWERHLEGVEPSLGIIPIRADSKCIWGCIDIDQYPLDHKALVKKIRRLELPLIVFRSKSGGAHVFMFSKEPISAADMQKNLKLFSAYLGHSGCEIFPKQTELLVDRGDTGNFLNLPYFGGDNGMRYAFDDEGEAASLEKFYELYDQYAILSGDEIPKPKAQETVLPDGPPCLQLLCAQGFPEGTRNNGLFNIGVYMRKAFPDTWEDEMQKANQQYMDPPLPLNELNLIVRQLKKKDYTYRCKSAPIDSHCNRSLCKTRQHGIGQIHTDGPSIAALSKYNSDPPLWFLDVEGKRIELTTEELQQQHKFQVVCMNKINIAPPTLKKPEWEGLLNSLLRQMVETQAITEAPEDTSNESRFLDLLEEFCTHVQGALEREELLMGRPWTDEEDNMTHFRLKDLEAFLVRNKFMSLTPAKIALRLRSIDGSPTSINIKGRTVRLWKIPAFQKQDAPFNVQIEQRETPF